MLLVVGLGEAEGWEGGQGAQQACTVVHCVSLLAVRDDVDVETTTASIARCLTGSDAAVDDFSQILSQSLAKVGHHGASTTENNVGVETSSDIDG